MADTVEKAKQAAAAGLEKLPQGVTESAPQFKATRSAAELAYSNAEGYADEGFAEHKGTGGKHLEEYWHKGYGGIRPEGEDLSDEEQKLHELEQHRREGAPGVVQRAKEAGAGAAGAVAGKVVPGGFKATKSAAELAYDQAEGYADEGFAQHKGTGGKHLEEHWHKGYGGIRPEGEDLSDEEEKLRELEQRGAGGAGLLQRAKETVTGTAAAAGEKASELLQTAKEMVGMEPKK